MTKASSGRIGSGGIVLLGCIVAMGVACSSSPTDVGGSSGDDGTSSGSSGTTSSSGSTGKTSSSGGTSGTTSSGGTSGTTSSGGTSGTTSSGGTSGTTSSGGTSGSSGTTGALPGVDSGTADPDNACYGMASDACSTCCDNNHAAGADIYNTAYDSCMCGPQGACQTQCAQTDCNEDNDASSVEGDACSVCEDTNAPDDNASGACGPTIGAACNANADCVALLNCYDNCP